MYTQLFALVVLLLVVAPTSAKVVEIGFDSNNTDVKAQVNDNVIVHMRGQPTTGHRWNLFYLEGTAIIQDGEPFFLPDHHNPGAPGIYVFPYRALSKGTAKLRLVEGRDWESQPVNVFACSFTVA
eukprot:TRINITY_DN9264_c0_g1_i1.p1 TRINITY_DN9264_c0_g1~~TRINITY_DN9264_c0_g1_i1.p1  ORF type:complete len:125 (+),score=27.71 TRINITY_DN9264_c0_g1_i1:70-444(+)